MKRDTDLFYTVQIIVGIEAGHVVAVQYLHLIGLQSRRSTRIVMFYVVDIEELGKVIKYKYILKKEQL